MLHWIARQDVGHVGTAKPVAWAAARVFCLLNGADIALGVDEAEALVVGAADGSLDVATIATRLRVTSADG